MVRSRLIPSSLFITACLSLSGCAQTSTAVQTEPLLKTAHAWEGTRYEAYPEGRPELSVLKITIPAKTTLNWHTHPMPNAAYLISGELLVETRDVLAMSDELEAAEKRIAELERVLLDARKFVNSFAG